MLHRYHTRIRRSHPTITEGLSKSDLSAIRREAGQTRLEDLSIKALEKILVSHSQVMDEHAKFAKAREEEVRSLRIDLGFKERALAYIKDRTAPVDAEIKRVTDEMCQIERQLAPYERGFFSSMVLKTIILNCKEYRPDAAPLVSKHIDLEKLRSSLDAENKLLKAEEWRCAEDINQLVGKINGTKFTHNEIKIRDGNKYRLVKNGHLWTASEIEKIQKVIEKKRTEQQKVHHLKAVAATHYGKQRDEAEKVKRDIRNQTRILSECPYCGTRLRIEEAHADHIYPVKKGGLSTLENMVYVCHSCNGKKRDMTLRSL